MVEETYIRDLRIDSKTSIADLIHQFNGIGGFSAAEIAKAVEILKEMIRDEGCARWLSFPAALMATGTRGVVNEMIRRGFFNYVITTCGTLDHDIARSFGEYHSGDFRVDDRKLLEEGIHRVGSVFIPQKSYGETIERFMQELLEDLYSRGVREMGSVDVCRAIGERLRDENSFLGKAYERGVLVFVPGIMDGAVGTQLWLFHQRHRDFKLNLFKDFDILADITFKMKKSGALIIGGGISKHHLIWWAQFGGGLDYAIQVTTAIEYDGSLSGASLSEAISWKKVKPTGSYITVHGEATVILPLISAALMVDS